MHASDDDGRGIDSREMLLKRNHPNEHVCTKPIKLLDALRLARNLVVLLGPLLVTKELLVHLRLIKNMRGQ
jgi:hypothetical protein